MQLPTTLAELPVAQWQPGPHGPGPHGPHWSGTGAGAGPDTGGMGPGLGLGMAGDWWLVFVLAVVLALLAVAAVVAARHFRDDTGDGTDGALAVLRKRYAAGDLDGEEFERRRDRLTGRTG